MKSIAIGERSLAGCSYLALDVSGGLADFLKKVSRYSSTILRLYPDVGY
jgi:hypothetical protein